MDTVLNMASVSAFVVLFQPLMCFCQSFYL